MSKGQNIIGGAKKVHFQDANVDLSASDQSPVAQIEVEKLSQIPYGTIHLRRDQKIEQDVEPCQNFELQSGRLQSQSQTSGDASSCKMNTANSNLSSFEAGHQNQLLSHVKKPVRSQKTSNILAALGLSSKDLDEVESYPKDKLTLDSLPKILKQIKKKRASLKHSKGDNSPQQSHSTRTSRDDGTEEKPLKERNSESQGIVRKPLVNYGYDPSSGESSAGSEQDGISGDSFRKKERHFSESPRHQSKFDSDSETESDYEVVEELPFPCAEELSLLEKKRRTPILQNIKDFLGYLPVVLPHCCSLCDKIIDTLQDWNDHMNDPLHKLRCLLLQRVYPDWVPGELPVAKKNPVTKTKAPTLILKKKVKVKRSTDVPIQSKRENPKEPRSRIVVLSNLPSSGFSDFDTVRLGSTFGKVLKYLKVGEKAFLKMDSEIATNNIIEHFKRKPLFYGRLLTANISSAQIQPLLKKPSAKIEEMLNKVNQADISARECFLGPILKNKPGDLKKYSTSERERRSSESSERAETKSSDESSETAEWKNFESYDTIQRRNRERMQRRRRERVERRSRKIIQRRSRERRLRRANRGRGVQGASRERGVRWASRERGGRRDSHERGGRRDSHERGERRGSRERADRRDSHERGLRRGSSERGEQGASIERGERGGSSQRGERGGIRSLK
ncbi:matrin-3-like [Heterodontus francisci]|uniref:matrin-3-like n=1 Tax=Heterodontus francisci TaxID=7792 RepID=UPI00355BE17F